MGGYRALGASWTRRIVLVTTGKNHFQLGFMSIYHVLSMVGHASLWNWTANKLGSKLFLESLQLSMWIGKSRTVNFNIR